MTKETDFRDSLSGPGKDHITKIMKNRKRRLVNIRGKWKIKKGKNINVGNNLPKCSLPMYCTSIGAYLKIDCITRWSGQ
jgi:hypothetical protein